MSLCNNEKLCLNAENINLTFQKTFEFIQENQLSTKGYVDRTTIYLKLSLTNIQFPLTKVRESAANTVEGYVNVVGKTNVTIIALTSCSDRFDEYTIDYSQIIQVVSGAISRNINRYLAELDRLPRICYECENQYTDMIINYKKLIKKYENDDTKLIKVIFDGVNSRDTKVVDLNIKRNFIIFEEAFIFPITVIGGYVIVPTCPEKAEIESKESTVKIGGREHV